MIIYYFDYNRADTIKEAINEYIRDQQHIAIINKLDEIKRSQIQAMLTAVGKITGKLNTMQNAVTAAIANVRAETERQTAVIEREAQKIVKPTRSSLRNLWQMQIAGRNNLIIDWKKLYRIR